MNRNFKINAEINMVLLDDLLGNARNQIIHLKHHLTEWPSSRPYLLFLQDQAVTPGVQENSYFAEDFLTELHELMQLYGDGNLCKTI